MKLVVVSPHLDDSVWSIGASMHRWHRRGHEVVSLTVFAGLLDPHPASEWDAVCGFDSGDTATRARRREDVRACGLVGAEARWLDLPDGEHCDAHDTERVWDAIEPELEGADVVLVPGWPRRHPDHAWLGTLCDERIADRCVVAHYCEQPYLAMTIDDIRRPDLDPVETRRGSLRWHHHRMSVPDLARKTRAVWAYRSQLRPQQSDIGRLTRYELRTRTESVAWPETAAVEHAALV